MSEPRTSARLRKRPRLSYTEPDDDEDLEGETSGEQDLGEDPTDTDDEEYHEGGHGKRRKSKPKEAKREAFFPLKKLPAELRNEIYALCLTKDTPILLKAGIHKGKQIVRQWSKHAPLEESEPSLVPNLVLTDRATYAEGGPVLFKNNFLFENSAAMYVFFQQLSPTTKQWVEKVSLHTLSNKSFDILFPVFNDFAGTTKLKHFSIGTGGWWRRNYMIDGAAAAEKFYRQAHNWLDAVVKEEGDLNAAVDIVEIRGFDESSRSRPRQIELEKKATQKLRKRLMELLK